jgi:hypothetical protein
LKKIPLGSPWGRGKFPQNNGEGGGEGNTTLEMFYQSRMRATLSKIGEGAFADVFGCQKEGWDKLAVKVCQNHLLIVQSWCMYLAVLACLVGLLRKQPTWLGLYTRFGGDVLLSAIIV